MRLGLLTLGCSPKLADLSCRGMFFLGGNFRGRRSGSHNPFKWPAKWITGVITPKKIHMLNPQKTGGGWKMIFRNSTWSFFKVPAICFREGTLKSGTSVLPIGRDN